MIFAAIIDAGLIPFFVFTAIISRAQYTQGINVSGRWQTLFNMKDATHKVIFSTFVISVVGGGLHLISLSLSIYLTIVFRKISKLPPDMNPLEDNLTSRHKRNKSSRVEKHSSVLTDATSRDRDYKADDPLMSPSRSVPFLHTRTESFADISLPNSSPRASRTDNVSPLYDEPERMLERFLHKNLSNHSIPTKASSVYSEVTHLGLSRPESTQPPSNRPQSVTPTIVDETENWTEYPLHPSPPPSPFEFKHLRTLYQPVPQSIPFDPEKFIPRPLEMNPPTPPHDKRRLGQHQRALLPNTGNTTNLGKGSERRQEYAGLVIGKTLANDKLRGTGRVISRSGIEIDGEHENRRGIRVREVSGKVAEEGRGDKMWRERGGTKF